MQNNNRLIILSVPYRRMIRSTLSPLLREALPNNSDVLIISPFADNIVFQEEFGGKNIKFFTLQLPKKFKWPFQRIYIISEILRMHGHWIRYRNQGKAGSVYDMSYIKGDNGEDIKKSFVKRSILRIIATIGAYRKSWKLVDKLIGGSIFYIKDLHKITKNYENILLIQGAHYGSQDRVLGWMANKLQWKAMFIPYTTDQFHNAFLFLDYEAVCVQGPFEYDLAIRYHKIDKNRIIKLGSAWAKYLEKLIKNFENNTDNGSQKKTIMYAGSIAREFPTESEFHGIDILLKGIKCGQLKDVKIIYRPFGISDEIKGKIEKRFSGTENLSIQYSKPSCYGLETYDGTSTTYDELQDTIRQIASCDLLVMALGTSLCLDFAYAGIPAISYIYDPSGVMKSRRVDLHLKDKRIEFYPDIPVVLSESQLIPMVKGLLENPDAAKAQAENTHSLWDYENADFKSILKGTIDSLI